MAPTKEEKMVADSWRSRHIFFALFMVASFQGRFMSVFLMERGLADSEVGAVLSISALVSIFAAPWWTIRADSMTRLDAKEVLLFWSVIGSEIAFAAQAAVDFGYIPAEYRFMYIFTCRVVSSIFFSTWHPLANAIAVQDLIYRDGEMGSANFGKERLWGAVSWALMHLLSGVLNEFYGTWTMYVGHAMATVCALYTINGWMRVKHKGHEERIFMESTHGKKETLCCGACQGSMLALVVKNPLNFAFFTLMFVSAMGMSLVENLLFIFFYEDLHAGAIVCGLSVVVTVVFEIPLFEFGPELLQRFGISMLLSIAMFAYIIRVILYTMVPQGWYVLLVEPLHGVTIAAVTVASNEFITLISPPNMRTSVQGLLASVRTGLGFFVGTLAGGWIMEWYGDTIMYRSFAGLVTAALCFYWLAVYAHVAKNKSDVDEETPFLKKSPFPGPVVVSRRGSPSGSPMNGSR